MLSPRFSRLLHRIGYVCTVLVAIEILAIGTLVLYAWLQHRREMAERLDQTRTHDGPLVTRGRHDLAADAIPLLALLPPRAAFAKGGLRFAAMPGLGWHWYAVSLRDAGERIEGTAVTVNATGDSFTNPVTAQFTVPRDAYAGLMGKLDALDDGYAGDTKGFCMDGTEIAFERIRHQQTTSGMGNSCIAHYQQIGAAVFALLRQSATLPYPPLNDDWHSQPSATQKNR